MAREFSTGSEEPVPSWCNIGDEMAVVDSLVVDIDDGRSAVQERLAEID